MKFSETGIPELFLIVAVALSGEWGSVFTGTDYGHAPDKTEDYFWERIIH